MEIVKETTVSSNIPMVHVNIGMVRPNYTELATELLDKFNSDELKSKYYRPQGKYRREFEGISYSIPETIVKVKEIEHKTNKLKELEPGAEQEITGVKDMINNVLSLVLVDGNVVKTKEFSNLYDIIQGVYEGIANTIYKGKYNQVKEQQEFIKEHKDKAFFRTLKSAVNKEKVNINELKKGLFSYGTHLEIYKNSVKDKFSTYEYKMNELLNLLSELSKNDVSVSNISLYIKKNILNEKLNVQIEKVGKVSDIDKRKDLKIVNNQREIRDIKQSFDNSLLDDFTQFFVLKENDEYKEVYGIKGVLNPNEDLYKIEFVWEK